MNYRIFAVDFDGTLCENNWPEIGKPNKELIKYLKKAQANGDKLILWTSRNEELTQKAVDWCKKQGLIFDAVNENLPESIEHFGGDSRKIYATDYIDDKNLPIATCREKSNFELWAENEVVLACQRENPDRKDREWDYGCACYESALKAFCSLLEDHHSGASIDFAKDILNRLIDHKPLSPIEDTIDIWDNPNNEKLSNGLIMHQCKRMSSLFKYEYPDGRIKYSDPNRSRGIDIKSGVSYMDDLTLDIVDELFPISMPYMPEDGFYEVHINEFKSDVKSRSADTVGVLYLVTPSLKRVEINRYFKKGTDGELEKIDEVEYRARQEAADGQK